jgi:hypothetical protein
VFKFIQRERPPPPLPTALSTDVREEAEKAPPFKATGADHHTAGVPFFFIFKSSLVEPTLIGLIDKKRA